MDFLGTHLCLEQFKDLMILLVGILVLHYVNLLTPAQNPRSSRVLDTVLTVCLVAPCIYMFPFEMMKHHALVLWAFVTCATREGTIVMLAVEALLLLSPVSSYLGWYNICICLPGLWSFIRSVDVHTTECSLIPAKESAFNKGGAKTAEPGYFAVHVRDEKVRATKRHHDNEKKRRFVVDNVTKGGNSNGSQISTGDNKDTPSSYVVTGVSGGNVKESITAGYVGRDINYEKTIRDNVVSGPSNIGNSVQQATKEGVSASGSTPEIDVDDPGENKLDLSKRNVITNNTVKQEDTTVTNSSLGNAQMKNVHISVNTDFSRIVERCREVTETDGDCDAHAGTGMPEITEDNRRDSNMREAVEIQTLLKDIKGEASETSSAVTTTMKRIENDIDQVRSTVAAIKQTSTSTSRQVEDDMDHLKSKVTELTAEVEILKKANCEAEEACSSLVTNVVARTTRQVENEMGQLRSKVVDLTRVIDTLRKTTCEVREATVTVATTKQEVASLSRQGEDQMDTFYSKAAELTTAINELKRLRCNCGHAHWHCH
ncbi:uncharacterized protein LOC124253938 [Haliotis rubra]|uniref:uncharacterized protein LOC124253938 n=1 Tax=Haliotis rubra TaxID=36100 RepID=UPI001EE4F718|nr:uncharacterized protein LOC124253938 [Haliotis rubra]